MARRLLTSIAVLALVLGACDDAADVTDQARSAVDDARTAVDDARSAVDEARTRLDDLATRAQDVRDRFAWCTAAASLGRAVAARDADLAAEAAEGLRTVLPEELVDELDTVVTAVELAQGGDNGALLDSQVREAARSLLETTITTCGVSSD